MTVVNVYFLGISERDDIFIVTDILNEIIEKLANIAYTHLIFGGDINCCSSPSSREKTWSVLCAKLSTLSIYHVPDLHNSHKFIQEK